MSARNMIAAAIGLAAVGSIVHCSASSAERSSTDTGPGPDAAVFAGDAGPNALFPGARDSSRGLILVHGSPNLPAFRLCFGKLSGSGSLVTTAVSSALPPLPDRVLMPDSNVVGVEIGSAVRLSPLGDPEVGVLADDRVFAIPEVYVRPGGGSDLPCSARICATSLGSTCLQKDPPLGQRGYYDLGQLPPGATQASVQLLVLHGCVPDAADAGVRSCGAGYNPAIGNMKLKLLPLSAYKTLKPEQFFVQVAQLSDEALGTTFSVRYGDLANPGSLQDIALSANFGAIAPSSFPENFTLNRSTPGIYDARGFRISVGPQVFTKSLAEIQRVTAPQALPNDLYASKSNFVLLLLGDPSLSDAAGRALSTMTEPGLLLHLLVVPVGQPVDGDGGTSDAGSH